MVFSRNRGQEDAGRKGLFVAGRIAWRIPLQYGGEHAYIDEYGVKERLQDLKTDSECLGEHSYV